MGLLWHLTGIGMGLVWSNAPPTLVKYPLKTAGKLPENKAQVNTRTSAKKDKDAGGLNLILMLTYKP